MLGSAVLDSLNVRTFTSVDLQDAVGPQQGDPGRHSQRLQSPPLPLFLRLRLFVLAVGVAVDLADLRPGVGPVHAETDVSLAGHTAAVLLPPEVPDRHPTELDSPPPVIVVLLSNHLRQPGRI